jgi:L-asparaginase
MVLPPKPDIKVGGYLPNDGSAFYMSRPEDDLLEECLRVPGTWINIFGCRTMGKTSLAIKDFHTLELNGMRCAYIDVSVFSLESESRQRWIANLAINLALRFKLEPKYLLRFLANLPSECSCGVSVSVLFEKLQATVQAPIYLVLDEIDSIMHLSWGLEVIAALRDLRGRRSGDTDLTLCLVGLQALGELCPAMSAPQSLFARSIEMLDFPRTDVTVKHLKRVFTEEFCPSSETLLELLDLTGGQPLLTMDLLSAVARGKLTDSAQIRDLARSWAERSLNGDRTHFELLLNIAAALTQPRRVEDAPRHFAALTAYEELLLDRSAASEAHTAPHKDLLLLVGIVRRNGALIEPKGRIFEDRLDLNWTREAQNKVAAVMQQPQNITEVVRAEATDRILVINTGGTIGMVVNSEGRVVPPGTNQEFREYFSYLKLIGDVEMMNLFPPRDSINVFPQQWKAIAKCIFERRNDGFKGIVVAHGTDTLAYTASAVAFALGPHLTFPVVFTGSQTGPNVAFGDAHVNLYRACETAKKSIPEVVICFGNYVYRAVRAQKKDDRRFEGFESPTYPPLAEITGEITVRSELLRSCPKKPCDISLKADFETSVLIVPMFPGLEPRFFEQLLEAREGAPASKGIIIQTLGAGNVSSIDPYSFIPFVRDAYLRGIPVIVTSHYPPDPGTHTKYAPAAAPLEAGAIHAGNMTMPAAVTKFRWVLAQVLREPGWERLSSSAKRNKVESLMVKKPLIGEF